MRHGALILSFISIVGLGFSLYILLSVGEPVTASHQNKGAISQVSESRPRPNEVDFDFLVPLSTFVN